MTSKQSFSIRIQEWPSRDDISDLLQGNHSKTAIQEFLTQEFDSIIQCKVDDFDILSGYPEAFILPLHAFLRNMSRGLKDFAQTASATVPIYLQQYEVSEGDPAHQLQLSWKGDALFLRFVWGGQVELPSHFAQGTEWSVDFEQFKEALVPVLKEYYQQVALLVGSLPGWDSKDVAALFADF